MRDVYVVAFRLRTEQLQSVKEFEDVVSGVGRSDPAGWLDHSGNLSSAPGPVFPLRLVR